MNKEIIKLSVLAFLAGLFSKIYDDLNDNNLYSYFYLDKNKEYINEFLKAAHYILLIYISSNHIYPLLLVLIPNIILMIKDPKAFELPYEYSGIIAFFIFSFYLIIDNYTKLQLVFDYNIIFYMTLYLVSTYIFDILLCNKVEFGYKKLAIRGFSVVILSLVLLINYLFKFLPSELTFGLWYIIGYCLTSSFFQMFLILKSKQDKTQDNEIKDDEIKDDEIKDDEIKDDEIKDDEIKDDEIKDDEIKDDEIKDET